MRILIATQQYPPALGGAERYIADVAESLVERGHQVDVLTTRSVDYRTWRNELPPGLEMIRGVRVQRMSSLPRRGHTWRLLHIGLRRYWQTRSRRWMPLIGYGNGPLAPGIAWTILRRAGHYDLLHINTLHYLHAWLAYQAATLRHLPVVITPHIHTGQRDTYDVDYMRAILQGCRAVFTNTQAEREFLLAKIYPGERHRQVTVSGYGLRLQNFPPLDKNEARAALGLPAHAFVMLFLGRKTEYKGLAHCLQAFAALQQQIPHAYFLAIGMETEDSQRLWNEYSTQTNLIVRDAVSDEERLDALAACDVLVLPSMGESFGIVYLEAWAYGKPVIGADIESIGGMISDGIDGYLISLAASESPAEQLYRRLVHLATNPQAAQAMGEAGRRKLHAQYTLERTIDLIEGVYARVLRQEAAQRRGLRPCAPA